MISVLEVSNSEILPHSASFTYLYVSILCECKCIMSVGTSSKKLLSWDTTNNVEGHVCRYLSNHIMALNKRETLLIIQSIMHNPILG